MKLEWNKIHVLKTGISFSRYTALLAGGQLDRNVKTEEFLILFVLTGQASYS